jgi:putative membrane protein
MWWHDGMGWGGWILMTMTMAASWSLVVFGLIALFRGYPDTRANPGAGDRDPRQILDERLARGEIDLEEHHAHLDALRAAH